MIGASGPKPPIPSWTIVPGAIATSVTWLPQALLTVPMSMPWSSVQAFGASTRESGLSGKTRPAVLVEPAPGRRSLPLAACLTAACRAAAVRRPTAPLAGSSPWAIW